MRSDDRFNILGNAYHIRVSAYIFCYYYDVLSDSSQHRVLLIQRAIHDSKPKFWEGPAGGMGVEDKTLQNGLRREVREETGLHLSKIAHSLPMQKWTSVKTGEWLGFSGIAEVCESEVVRWENDIKLNPKEHQNHVWATEDEVRSGKYKFFGENRTQTLKAFSVMRKEH